MIIVTIDGGSAGSPATASRRVGVNLLGAVVFAVISTSFKRGIVIQTFSPKRFPSPATLQNFSDAIHRPYFREAGRNSLIVVSVIVTLSLVLAFLAALARFRFRGRRVFIVLIIAVQMVPLNALKIPLYISLSRVGQVNKLTGLIATYLTFVLPFGIWTLRGFVLGLPKKLEEAAPGGRLLPLRRVRPDPAAARRGRPGGDLDLRFHPGWNEYTIAYVLLSTPDKQTLTVWLAGFTTLRGTDWGSLMAGATLTRCRSSCSSSRSTARSPAG